MTTETSTESSSGYSTGAARSANDGVIAEPTGNISRGRLVLRRFRRKRLAMFGLVLLCTEAASCYIGPMLDHWQVASLDPDPLQYGVGPDSLHWFGTDNIGHDLFAQTMSGTQKSMLVGLIAAVVSTLVAAVVGSVAGYFGKLVDNTLMWFVNLMMVVPSFLILAILSPRLHASSFVVFALLLAAFNWMLTARVVRGLTFSLREREFISAAKFIGVPAWRIIARHVLPNMASLLIVDVTINVSGTILTETGLSYFGFGVQPPNVSLGTLIQNGTSGPSLDEVWLWGFPGLMLMILVLSVNFIGDGLRDALDATSRAEGI
ncbi:MAG TPA: ABC transporter permease [Jatrophihabitantaceae bacterium]|jgi:peptide/nickel transport system permease protein|nr:ABC transporter permease [Jatrophihabitantaceae bacterium]